MNISKEEKEKILKEIKSKITEVLKKNGINYKPTSIKEENINKRDSGK